MAYLTRFRLLALGLLPLTLLLPLAGCSPGSGGTCIDLDLDGYGVGAGCVKVDCNDADKNHFSDCLTCSDPDGDGRGAGCDPGLDCNPTNPAHWADCASCTDEDSDGRGEACDRGPDCDEKDPDVWEACGSCVDADRDAHFSGCDAYVKRPGPDCDDEDADNWLHCKTCGDADGDGRFARCDAYTAHMGPDCNDDDKNNWMSCGTCRDADADKYYGRCDAYMTILGPDCNDASPLHWSDCSVCVDGDRDGRGAGCNAGPDCSDSDRDNWISCGTCLDKDGDSRFGGCDSYFTRVGPDCNDADRDNWMSCASCTDVDGDGYRRGCDAYVVKPGPDCNDGDPNNWTSCGTCRDQDADRRFNGCNAYLTILGPDCGDLDPNNWMSCATCTDADGDGRRAQCDAYLTISGPDCNDASRYHWSDCGMCTDADGDNRGAGCNMGADCNEASVQHWADCGSCTDGDGDGYGSGCDLGTDCADMDPARNPGVLDPTTDGLDQNCDGLDGPSLFDDFDDGSLDPALWPVVTGDAAATTTTSASGSHSLHLGGGFGEVQTAVLDTTSCGAIGWRYRGKRGPDAPEFSDYLLLEYYSGASWVTVDTWYGSSTTDTSFSLRQGLITAPAALGPGFRARLRSIGSGIGSDDFFVDDFAVGCAIDGDRDGTPDATDCAPADRDHWSDCGSCFDSDSDDYGSGCNRGPDCVDTNPAINPAAADLTVDGIDQNCDGIDGPTFTATYSATPALSVTDGNGSSVGCAAVAAVSSVINVPAAGTIVDVDVTVTSTHPRTGDLDMYLQFSNGGAPICIHLSTDNGAGANYSGTIFDDEATTYIFSGASPFTGRFRPEGLLSSLERVSMTGDWTLWISDDTFGSAGTLDSWGLTITYY